jgi:hypothetical protein
VGVLLMMVLALQNSTGRKKGNFQLNAKDAMVDAFDVKSVVSALIC